MTRTVSKILATIAMVVVLPLMVVGTAFVAFFSTDTTITVSAVVDEYVKNDPTNAPKIQFDGKLEKSHKITAGQNKTIDVFAQKDLTGYNFEGWFAGSEAEYKAAVKSEQEIKWVADANQPKLSVKMEEAAVEYVAVYSIVRFDIAGWSYAKDPTQAGVVSNEPPTNANSTYKYEEALPTKSDFSSYAGSDWSFRGWKIQGANSTGFAYNTATFQAEEIDGPITLVAVWKEASKSAITYYDEDGTVLEVEYVTAGEEYTLPSARTKKGDKAEAGYTYAWESAKNAKDNVTKTETLDADKEYSFYIYKTPISYTVSVEAVGAKYKNGTASNIKFDLENMANLEALFNASKWDSKSGTWYGDVEYVEGNWTFDSKLWEFGGIKFNGNIKKTADELATAIAEANPDNAPDGALTLTLEIVKNYEKFTVTADTLNFFATEDADEASDKLQTTQGAGENDVTASYKDADTTLTLGEIFGYTQVESGTYYAKIEGQKYKVSLTKIELTVNTLKLQANVGSFADVKDLTMLDLIEQLISDSKYDESTAKIIQNIVKSDAAVETLTFSDITGIYNITDQTISA